MSIIKKLEISLITLNTFLSTTYLELLRVNPTRGRGADSARPEEKLRFWYILVIQLTQKIRLSPNSYDNASHTLLGSQNGLKMGFYSIFVVGWPKIWIRKCSFLVFLGLK